MLAGRVLGLPVLARLFPACLPMAAPSTALLLTLYGGIAAVFAAVAQL